MARPGPGPETSPAPDPARNGRPGTGAGIASVASALPDGIVTNAAIAERIGVSEDWIVSRTGIHERRHAAPDETLVDFAALAGRAALERAGLEPGAVDLVLVATFTADHVTPNAAPLVAHRLGTTSAGAMDIGAACTGFLSGLSVAAAQVEAGRARCVLLIGADLVSRVTDPDDRRTAALFADGAGAMVLTAVPGRSAVGPVILGADGSEPELLIATHETRALAMEGQEVFKHAVARMSEATRAACAAAGVGLEDIDLFVYHQANARILRSLGTRLGLPVERVVDSIAQHGNTSAASIPIALAEAEADGRLKPGARVLISAFGAGFTWGGVAVEWRAS